MQNKNIPANFTFELNDYLAIIPARGGSKGIKNKNLKACAGRPLVEWSLRSALDSNFVNHTVLSTDSEEILELGIKLGLSDKELRPSKISGDHTPTEDVMIYEVERFIKREGYAPEAVVLLQPTSPARNAHHVDGAIELFRKEKADSLLSVCRNHHFFWKKDRFPVPLYDFKNRPRRQDLLPDNQWYRETGAIYVCKTEGFLTEKNRLFGNISMFEMSESVSFDIDSLDDLISANAVMANHLLDD